MRAGRVSRSAAGASARAASSLDDLGGPDENHRRHGQAQRFGGLKIDYQLEPGGLLDWQISGLGALEDLSGVHSDLTNRVGEARPIADQAAGAGESAPVSNRRNGMACSQRH